MAQVMTSDAREATSAPRWVASLRPGRDTLLGASTIVGLLLIWELVFQLELMPLDGAHDLEFGLFGGQRRSAEEEGAGEECDAANASRHRV